MTVNQSLIYETYRTPFLEYSYIKFDCPYKLPFERYWNVEKVARWLHHNWHHSITIAIFYIITVHGLQKIMKDRKPVQMRPILIAWNVALALFSMLGWYRMSQELVFTLRNFGLLASICYSIDAHSVAMFWCAAFVFSKAVELGDTVFVILRKRPLIFLHWYHHAAVLIYSFHTGREFVAAGRWFGWMNYGVHSLMYSYYAVTAAGYRMPKLVSMCVTTLQTVQMLVGVLITFTVYFLKRSGTFCQQSWENLYIGFLIYITFAILFIKLFFDAYVHPRVHSDSVQHKKLL